MRNFLIGATLAAALIAGGLPAPAHEQANGANDLQAGTYALDKAHASLVFHVSHMGFSNFTSRFSKFDATLNLDPANPSASSVSATIDPVSIEIYNSTLGTILQGADWFDSGKFPEMRFRSSRVTTTGPHTARVTGDLTLRGATQSVAMDVTFNGGYRANPMDPSGARVGFSAHGSLKRSLFGMNFGLPPAGSNMGVGDDVAFEIEAEFSRPATPR